MDEQPLNTENLAWNRPESPPRWRGLAITYALIAGAGIVMITLIMHGAGWFADQLALYMDQTIAPWSWPVLSLIAGLSAAVIGAGLPFLRRMPRVSAIGLAWLSACVAAAILGLTRLVPVADGELQLLVQTASFAVIAAAMWLVMRRGRRAAAEKTSVPAPGAFWLALCAGGVTILPWAWFGALGSPTETLLAATAALALAGVAAVVLGDRYWSAFNTADRPGAAAPSTAVRVWAGGAGAGVALLVLGSCAGAGGVQVPVMITVAALSFAIAAILSRSRACGRVVAAAVAPAVFGPLAFIDGDEFVLALSSPEIASWSGIALGLAILIAWAVAIVYGFTHRHLTARPSVAAGIAVIIAAAAVGAAAGGQPGFYGEKVLVVMDEQADLSGISGDRETKLTQVHQRLKETAESSQKSLRSQLDERGLDYRPFYLLNAIEVDTGPLWKSWLTKRDDVSKVLLSPQLRPLRDAPAPQTGRKLGSTDPQPNIKQVGAVKAWDAGATGEGITIGISDSGVEGDHPALADRFRGGDDSWADPVNNTREPYDPNGHGTHALGLALGADGIGVAPQADWIGCSNLPRNAANPADYLACLEFMLAPYPHGGDPFDDGDPQRAAHVLTNSWGCPAIEGCDATVLNGAIEALDSAGVFVVVAAGNSGPTCGSAGTAPANAPDAYSVGAVDEEDKLASFSSRGPVTVDGKKLAKPEISAPGVEVVSSLPGGGYGPNTGTSMAGPHVAGAVAALWSANEDLIGDVEATKEILSESATPVTKTGDDSAVDDCGDNAAGSGRLALDAAVAQS